MSVSDCEPFARRFLSGAYNEYLNQRSAFYKRLAPFQKGTFYAKQISQLKKELPSLSDKQREAANKVIEVMTKFTVRQYFGINAIEEAFIKCGCLTRKPLFGRQERVIIKNNLPEYKSWENEKVIEYNQTETIKVAESAEEVKNTKVVEEQTNSPIDYTHFYHKPKIVLISSGLDQAVESIAEKLSNLFSKNVDVVWTTRTRHINNLEGIPVLAFNIFGNAEKIDWARLNNAQREMSDIYSNCILLSLSRGKTALSLLEKNVQNSGYVQSGKFNKKIVVTTLSEGNNISSETLDNIVEQIKSTYEQFSKTLPRVSGAGN